MTESVVYLYFFNEDGGFRWDFECDSSTTGTYDLINSWLSGVFWARVIFDPRYCTYVRVIDTNSNNKVLFEWRAN